RDLKPGNIFLAARDDPAAERQGAALLSQPFYAAAPAASLVKLLDFGLARPVGNSHVTRPGAILAPPSYIAPDPAPAPPVDHLAGLSSVAVILYAMATGQRPFRAPDVMAVLHARATETPPEPHALHPEVPLALSRLAMRLLAKKPEDRPQSAAEVLRELA